MAFLRGVLSRYGALVALLVALASCAERPSVSVLHPVVASAGVGAPVDILVATTRRPAEADGGDFTAERNFNLNYESFTVSTPPNHAPGKIEWPSSLPGNPASDFTVTKAAALNESGFITEVVRASHGSGQVVVFVHGYNTSYQEAIFRVAQLKKDSGYPNAVVVFAWPSEARLTGYAADRESATYSRDYLEATLNELARSPGIRRIDILAHSMGNWLAVETLRQAKLRSRSPFLSKLGDVFLMSPDIDVDVFRTQLDTIGKLKTPITVGISRDDKALGVSQYLAGDIPRVGNVLIDNKQAQEAIAHYGLRVIDMSDVSGADSFNHSKFVGLIPALNQIAKKDDLTSRGTPISRAGLFVVNAAGSLLPSH